MLIHGNGIRVGTLILVIALAGVFCLSTWASEPKTNNSGDADKAAQLAAGSGSDNGPGVLEQEQGQPLAKIARKHFPWLWIATGVVVVGVILYFTVIKKPEYKLNVSIGAGVSGYPIAGAFVYKKGKKVRYLYSFGYGYRALKVMLDGKEVTASGEFNMDRDHVLAVSSEEQFYDVRGTWRITASNAFLFPTQEVVFAGSPATGKIFRPDGIFVLGDYNVTSNEIRFWAFVSHEGGSLSPNSEFEGIILDVNTMNGTCKRWICDGCGYAHGTWAAVRVR